MSDGPRFYVCTCRYESQGESFGQATVAYSAPEAVGAIWAQGVGYKSVSAGRPPVTAADWAAVAHYVACLDEPDIPTLVVAAGPLRLRFEDALRDRGRADLADAVVEAE